MKVLCAHDLRQPPARYWLDGCEVIRVFRGRPGATRRDDGVLEVGLDDGYASNRHLLLRRAGDAFVVSDEGSTNGTWVDGWKLAPGEERRVQTGFLEVGETFLYLRSRVRGTRDSPTIDGEPMTFNPEFALTLAAAGRLARRSHDLLITGESGVGKEVIARWLHKISGRRGQMVAVNCAAVPEHLLEDELFGHLKGAFSGADSDRTGLIRAAHEGTLLLDEVGDMPLTLQAKLLRVLEDRRVRPLGGEREVPVDVLVIAATHHDLRARVAEGEFREDLLARLGLLPLPIPPLRARREDLGLLIRRMLLPARLEEIHFEADALRLLLLHPWPLNVRELRRILLAAVDLAREDDEGSITVGPQHLRLTAAEVAAVHASGVPAAAELKPEDQQLRNQLVQLLRVQGGNVAAVARKLGKPRTQVQRLMARLGVDRKPG
ncbi:MAG TPA: sigma 54-interacting transcriptional regulator [Myxococcaceae bacterium]|nr:sigma 54-interacting transcriptional regulator [Myxococcaceae bacterium]